MTARTYWGKYRGMVVDNRDPDGMGRIQAKVGDVLGDHSSTWAMPCLPMTGNLAGAHLVPPVGAGVWIEFEQGDPNKPIWCGGFWGGSTELPEAASKGKPGSPSIVLQTPGGNNIVISDLPGPRGGITLELESGSAIGITDVAITISNPQGATLKLEGPLVNISNGMGASIAMEGPSVNINNGALVVI
jgi:Type VI secretion system/phage-baseplate injector OB domain